MSHDDRTSQANLQAQSQPRLTPEERRALLRDFADRMLLKVTAMDDPEDAPGVERAVRTAAAIERIYSRCDRAEVHAKTQAPALKKAEAEHAHAARDAVKARVALATTLEWGDRRSRELGPWWEAADTSAKSPAPPSVPVNRAAQSLETKTPVPQAPIAPAVTAHARADTQQNDIDDTDAIMSARARLGFPPMSADERRAAPGRERPGDPERPASQDGPRRIEPERAKPPPRCAPRSSG